jgi:hypothetical protein
MLGQPVAGQALKLLAHLDIGTVYAANIAPSAKRIVVSRGSDPQLLLDMTSGKELAKLPEGTYVTHIDDAGQLGVTSADGETVRGKWVWEIGLWDLAKAKKLVTLAKNEPNDKVAIEAFGKTKVFGIRKKKSAYSFCFYDRKGKSVKETKLGKVDLPFHGALSADERFGAHAYFTGAAHLVDLTTGKSQKLEGGTLKIGRQHEKGIHSLAFDDAGAHVMYVAPNKVHVWSTATRKTSSGAWTKANVTDAWFTGAALVVAFSGPKGSTLTSFALDGAASEAIAVGKGEARFAHAGERVAVVADKTVALWNGKTGKRIAKAALPKAMEAIANVALSSDRIAVADRKNGVAIYGF